MEQLSHQKHPCHQRVCQQTLISLVVNIQIDVHDTNLRH